MKTRAFLFSDILATRFLRLFPFAFCFIFAASFSACGGGNGGDGSSSLINTENEPPGENCPYGGFRVDVGLDHNGDGVLEEDEVDSTFYVCDGEDGAGTIEGEVLEGSYIIRNNSDISFLDGISEITGDLTVDAKGLTSISLPNLVHVGGDLIITHNDTLAEVGFAGLSQIDGDLTISHNNTLSEVTLSSLSQLGGGFFLHSNASYYTCDAVAIRDSVRNSGWLGRSRIINKFDLCGSVHGFVGSADVQSNAVTVDPDDNLIVTGSFEESAFFGDTKLTSQGASDVFIVKYSPEGSHIWSRRFGGVSLVKPLDITSDKNGNIVLTGYFSGTINLGGLDLTSQGANDIFLAKYSPEGTHIWSKSFGGSMDDMGFSVFTDSDGDIILTGSFRGTANFGGMDLTSNGLDDIFLAKYSSDGAHLWSLNFGGSGHDYGQGVTFDLSDNIILIGSFVGTANFGGDDLSGTTESCLFLAKFDNNGFHIWSDAFCSAGGMSSGRSVTSDSNDNIAITGSFDISLNFGGSALPSLGARDLFLAKFDELGAHIWSRGFGGGGSDRGESVVFDENGNLILTGYYEDSINFGGLDFSADGAGNALLAKFDVDGEHLWSAGFLGTGLEVGRRVTVDSGGNVAAAGYFNESINIGGRDFVSEGGFWGGFLVKLPPTGL